jgi:hypothetical protein
MASEQHDREDLLREATALVERVELQVADHCDSIIVGFRRDASASVFFGADPVYHFNSTGELRRAFWNDRLYKAEQKRLVSLRRERTQSATQLVRRELTEAEQSEFRSEMRRRLLELIESVAGGHFRVVGQVPNDADVVRRLEPLLPKLADAEIAHGPRVG